MKHYRSILVVSDLHFPFHHPDIFAFYKALKKEIRPDLVVGVGDEIDGHAWSYHESETDAMGPDHEFDRALAAMKQLYKIFPAMEIVESNHTSLHQRKAKTGQIPTAFIKSYKEAFRAPQGYHWHNTFKPRMSNGEPVYICHGMGANAFNNAMDLGISFVQGHHHGRLEALQRFCPYQKNILFGMTVGCGIDPQAYAFRYGHTVSKKPKIGCGAIINSHPVPIPMILNKNGRWTGRFK